MGTLGVVDPQGPGEAQRGPVIRPSSLVAGLACWPVAELVITLGEPAAITLGGPAAISLGGLGCDQLNEAASTRQWCAGLK